MTDVTAALDTWRAAAIDGSEGRKILVASVAVAANAQITAMQAGIDRCSNPGAETSLGTYSVMVRALKSRPSWWLSWRVDHPEQPNCRCRPANLGDRLNDQRLGRCTAAHPSEAIARVPIATRRSRAASSESRRDRGVLDYQWIAGATRLRQRQGVIGITSAVQSELQASCDER